jgi:hypothetical protein
MMVVMMATVMVVTAMMSVNLGAAAARAVDE